MNKTWIISQKLEAALEEIMSDPETTRLMSPGVAYYPTIVWATGGTLSKADETIREFPPHYGFGFIDDKDPGRNGVTIPSATFGVVIFVPNDADRASSRRLLDIEGKSVIVR
ncbi:MAG: hypothetical protein KDJ19_06290 [Hyphomicrobiaceae bacterium]|nr:hypothetical protein [Hyphomicrobiaceae bacterium]